MCVWQGTNERLIDTHIILVGFIGYIIMLFMVKSLTVWTLSILFVQSLLESTLAFAPWSTTISTTRTLTFTSTTTATSFRTLTPIMTPLPNASVRSPVSVVTMMVESDDDESSSSARVEPGTHDELMYALGVNLARQLGDIRPLVNDGEELAQLAKGLLDTVVGRLNDEGQRTLLMSRGKELDELIVSRA